MKKYKSIGHYKDSSKKKINLRRPGTAMHSLERSSVRMERIASIVMNIVKLRLYTDISMSASSKSKRAYISLLSVEKLNF